MEKENIEIGNHATENEKLGIRVETKKILNFDRRCLYLSPPFSHKKTWLLFRGAS